MFVSLESNCKNRANPGIITCVPGTFIPMFITSALSLIFVRTYWESRF